MQQWARFKNNANAVNNCLGNSIIENIQNDLPIIPINGSPRPARGRQELHHHPGVFHFPTNKPAGGPNTQDLWPWSAN